MSLSQVLGSSCFVRACQALHCRYQANLAPSLLSPIGEHRARHVSHSKGKRDKKRKRGETKEENVFPPASPPPPELVSHIDVGLVAVTRRLQQSGTWLNAEHSKTEYTSGVASETSRKPYAVVFVARAAQPSILNSHLPQLIAVASQACTEKEPIRLFGISKACEARLSEALGLPRASCIALDDGAPGAAVLLDFVRKHVSPITLDWLAMARTGDFQSTSIKHIATTIGMRKQTTKV